jgi:hypothetical protein
MNIAIIQLAQQSFTLETNIHRLTLQPKFV